MNVKEAESIVKRISYKSNTSLQVLFYPGDNTVKLQIKRFVKDASSPTRDPPQEFESLYPLSAEWLECLDEKTFVGMVLAAVKRMELHEVREWFKLDGKSVEEPHVGKNKPLQEILEEKPQPGYSSQHWPQIPYSCEPIIIDRKCLDVIQE